MEKMLCLNRQVRTELGVTLSAQPSIIPPPPSAWPPLGEARSVTLFPPPSPPGLPDGQWLSAGLPLAEALHLG